MKISLFISYTTGDKQHFDKLEAYLKYLQRQVNITYSHAELIPGGVSRQQWLRDRIEQSQLNVCLVSADYLANMYEELSQLLQQKARGVTLVPILVRPAALLEGDPLAALMPLPRNRKPVSEWSSADAAWQEIAQELLAQIKNVQSPPSGRGQGGPVNSGGEEPGRSGSAEGDKSTMGSEIINTRKLRNLIDALLRTDSDLEAFCLDFFMPVKRQFSNGMDRNRKVSLLLDQVEDHKEIVKALEEAEPQKFAKHRHLLS